MDSDFDDEDEDEADPYEGKFGFYLEDMSLITPLVAAIRGMITRDDLTPRQISELGVFLYAVERLPMVTKGVSMAVMLKFSRNHESIYKQVRIDEESFQLDKGGYVYDPAVGGDSFGNVIFEVSEGGGRDGEIFEAIEFMESFSASSGDEDYQVMVENDSSEGFDDWDQLMPEDPWDGLESEY